MMYHMVVDYFSSPKCLLEEGGQLLSYSKKEHEQKLIDHLKPRFPYIYL